MVCLPNATVRKLVAGAILLGGLVPGVSYASCAISTSSTNLGRVNSATQLKSMLGEVRSGQVFVGSSPVIKYDLTGCVAGANTVRAEQIVFSINGSVYKMTPWLVSFDNVNLVQPVNLSVDSFPFQHFGLTRTLGVVLVPENFPDTIPPNVYMAPLKFYISDGS